MNTTSRDAPELAVSEATERESLPARVRGGWVPLVITLTVLALLAAGGLALFHAEGQVNKVALASQPRGVTAVRAHATEFKATRRYVGTMQPWQRAGVGPQLVSGFVGAVLVRPGDRVKRGAVLATLDCRNASAGSKALALEARALETQQQAAAKEVARMEQMLNGGYASHNEVEQKLAQSQSSAAHIQSLMARLQGKELEVNDCVMRAPFTGEVAERFVDPGAFVRPGASIVTVIDREVVRLSADVPESDFEVVAPGKEAQVRLLAQDREMKVRISRRSPSADPETRTIHIELDIADARGQIPVGTTAVLTIDVGEPQPALELPLAAATIRGESATLWLVEDDLARKAEARVLGESGGSVFIAPTLAQGALVVTNGRGTLKHEQRVAAKTESWR